MEIPSNNIRIKSKSIQNQVKSEGKTTTSNTQAKFSSTGSTEQVAISSKAKDIQQATKAVNDTPDIRVEKVERIKEKIADGNYHVSSDELAEKVLKNMITESEFLG
jgi:negative regulator of flagellin synthesis FlgM